MDILELCAVEQQAELRAGAFSAEDLMQATLKRVEAVNLSANAIVNLANPDQLIQAARRADGAEPMGSLHGIPIAIKDLASAEGFVTSMGSPIFAGFKAQRDEIMVARLRAAGAIVIGKTNTPEFGLGSHTFNLLHGATRNPYDLTRSSGGSSGGAAAALASRMLSIADGSDMMGSLRNPAGWNNVYGMRPSWGLVPSEPVGDTFLHQLSTAGPMARCPADLAMLLAVMAGPDARQPHGVPAMPLQPFPDHAPEAARIGWLSDWSGAFPMEDGILSLSEKAIAQFGAFGHSVHSKLAPFDADAMWEAWITLRSFSVAAGLGVLFEDPQKRDHLKPEAQWEIERGLALTAMQVHRASEVRSDWFRTAANLFETCDVLVLPSAQLWPFPVDWTYPVEIAGQAMDTYHRWMQVVVPASLIGLPVVNIPIGFGENGLPAGLQLIGKRGSDALLLQLANQWHDATHWPQERPPQLTGLMA